MLERVKLILKQKKMTQQDLARKLDITYQSLNSTLNNENMQISTLQRIADAMEVDISDLFERPNEVPIYKKDEIGNETIIGWLKK